jgi:hypothetical protein
MQAHPTIFKSSEIGTELSTYASVHKDALEKKFEEAHDLYKRPYPRSGSIQHREEAERHIKGLRQQDPNFDIFICEIGKWCPWNRALRGYRGGRLHRNPPEHTHEGYKSNIDDHAYKGETRDSV